METSAVVLRDGYKYALLSLPRLHAITTSAPILIAEEGYALTRSAPVDDIEQWRESFGWYRYRNLADAGCYLVVYARSKRPDVLDHENLVLEQRVHRFHLGLLIGSPFIAYDESVFLEGARRNGKTDIRGHTTYDPVFRMTGGPAPYLQVAQLKNALALGRATRRIRRSKAGQRFGRVLTAFRTGLHERSLDVRVHQFVRCVEAFVGSWRKDQFAERTLELADNIPESDLIQLYDIRSAVEHFGGWKKSIAVRGDDAKERVLLERSVQIQLIAHSVLQRFVATPSLWPHFVDQGAVDRFRRNSQDSDRRALWGPNIDVRAVVRRLDFSHMQELLNEDS